MAVVAPDRSPAQEAAGEAEEPGGEGEDQQAPDEFEDLFLGEILGPEVSVTTLQSQSQRETPGIVTVITRDELQRSGARDLTDVLQLVPGFQFGVDIFGLISTGFRGNWGNEGKILILLDGHELHELSYLNNLFGNRVSVDWIERIEIIRGPGSVIYGGAAELAVISITTRKKEGGWVSGAVTVGQMLSASVANGQPLGDTFARRNLSFSAGYRDKNDVALRLNFFTGQGNRSDREYRDVYFQEAPAEEQASHAFWMGQNSRTDPFMLELEAEVGKLRCSFLFENFWTTNRDGYDAVFPFAVPNQFLSSSLLVSYEVGLGGGLRLVPSINFMVQKPWRDVEPQAVDLGQYWNPTVLQGKPSLLLFWEPLKWARGTVGLEYASVKSEDLDFGYDDPVNPDRTVPSVSTWTLAAFAQAAVDTPIVNVSAGARFENNDIAGLSLVPRAALTKAFGDFHFKALFSMAHRVPGIENLGVNRGLGPERTTVYELELGYRFTDFLYLAINGFDITIDDAIVYVFSGEGDDEEGYQNRGRTGTRGFETELRFKLKRVFANASFSYYDATDKNDVEAYQVPGRAHVLLGQTPYKLTFQGGLEIAPDLTLALSLLFLGDQRFSFDAVDADGSPRFREYPAEWLFNAHLLYRNLFGGGWFAGLGLYNLLDTRGLFLQPYNGYHAPQPGPSLEVLLRLGFEG